MDLSREEYLNIITERLSFLRNNIDLYNENLSFYSFKSTEAFYANLLNLVYNWNLEYLNNSETNIVSVDLYDKKNRLAVTVTSNTSFQDIKKALCLFSENHYGNYFDRLIFFIITKKVVNLKEYVNLLDDEINFDPSRDIWDSGTLLRDISSSNYPLIRIKGIAEYLEENISNISTLPVLTARYPERRIIIGREKEKKDIYIKTKSAQVIAINGGPGIGKTTLVVDLCYRLENEGYQVGWIQCTGDLFDSILQIRIGQNIKGVEARRKEILEWLSKEHENTILVFDNVDWELTSTEREVFTKIHPSIKVIITTTKGERELGLDKQAMYYLPEMSFNDARALFCHYYECDDEVEQSHNIDAIIHRVHGNALITMMMARLASVNSVIIPTIVNAIIQNNIINNSEHIRPTILQDMIQKYPLPDMGEKEIKILRLFSIMPEEKIIWNKISEWSGFDTTIMKKLIASGWINQDEQDYEISGIIKKSLQIRWKEMNFPELQLDEYGNLIKECYDLENYDLSAEFSFLRSRLFLPEALEEYLWENETQYSEDAAWLSNNIGSIYLELGDYNKSLRYNERCLTIREKILPQYHVDIANSYNNISSIFIYMGNHQKALEYLNKALNIQIVVFGKNHPTIASTYRNIGIEFSNLGNHQQSLTNHKCALAILKNELKEDPLEFAMTYNNIGLEYNNLGNHMEALRYKEKALSILEKLLSTDHMHLATSYYSIGLEYKNYGDHKMALEFLHKVKSIYEEMLPENDSELAKLYYNIGEEYNFLEDYSTANEYYNKASSIRQLSLPLNLDEVNNSVITDLKIPVGGELFEEIRLAGEYYVDKTELLYDLVEKTGNRVTLFTRPRRFGKTLTMTMIKSFFDITSDSKEFFRGLSIMKRDLFCQKWMNKYPVIFLTLKNVEGLNFDEALRMLRYVLSELCKSTEYLLSSPKVNQSDKTDFRNIMSRMASTDDLKSALKTIMRMMYQYYDKQVILLIDEYDVPLAKANENGYYREMLDIIRGFLGIALKTNEYLKFAVVTGCLRIAKESIFTGVNNFVSYSICDNAFSEYFGFTHKEVNQLLKIAGFLEKESTFESWYAGYTIGNTSVYCPWDVTRYLADLLRQKDAKPQNYWKNTSGNGIIKEFVSRTDLNVSEKFETLMNEGYIEQRITDELTYDTLYKTEDNLWSVLLMTGYLTLVEAADYRGTHIKKLKIPNLEILNIFEDSVISVLQENLDRGQQQQLMDALWNGNEEQATKSISDFLWDTISYHNYHEDFYHAFISGIFTGIGYGVKTDREMGLGRTDIVLTDRRHRRAIIIEAKKSDRKDCLEIDCTKATNQILQKRYAESLKDYVEVKCYGIAFYQKSALVRRIDID